MVDVMRGFVSTRRGHYLVVCVEARVSQPLKLGIMPPRCQGTFAVKLHFPC